MSYAFQKSVDTPVKEKIKNYIEKVVKVYVRQKAFGKEVLEGVLLGFDNSTKHGGIGNLYLHLSKSIETPYGIVEEVLIRGSEVSMVVLED
ncbi:MAG: hypothetical protein J7K98_00940 [Candidatus Aenigmarchaeota archaeon]|nr:hypothetical protein [Candidatus Aenigmarchaeota archaeon]